MALAGSVRAGLNNLHDMAMASLVVVDAARGPKASHKSMERLRERGIRTDCDTQDDGTPRPQIR